MTTSRAIATAMTTRLPPARGARERGPGLTVLFVGVCALRKGVHFALEAWLRSPASASGGS